MKTLLLVGGNSTRFHDAGYSGPKAVLPGRDDTILKDVLKSLAPTWLVTAASAPGGAKEIELAVLRAREHWKSWTPVWNPGPSLGPLYGLLDAAPALHAYGEDELVVSYCDVILKFGIAPLLDAWRGHLSGAVIFRSMDPRFGYWDPYMRRVVEKKRVSGYAVSGVFYFRSAFDAIRRAGEIAQPGAGIVDLLDESTELVETKVFDVGTPIDYREYVGAEVPA